MVSGLWRRLVALGLAITLGLAAAPASASSVPLSSLGARGTPVDTDKIPILPNGASSLQASFASDFWAFVQAHLASPGAIGATTPGKVYSAASTTSSAGLNIAPGVAPTSPANGDCWLTASAFACRIGGATQAFPLLGTQNNWTARQWFLNDIVLSGAAGTSRNVYWLTGSTLRWSLYANSTAEAGSNVGSDLSLARYNDAGTYLDSPVTINRASGYVSINNGAAIGAGLTVGGGLTISSGSITGGGLAGAAFLAVGTSAGTVAAGNDARFYGPTQNSRSAGYTLVLGDAGGQVYHPSADTAARTWVIPVKATQDAAAAIAA